MFQDLSLALSQIGDPRFRRVLFIGVGLTIALLAGATFLFVGAIDWFVPDQMTLPFIGEITWVDNVLSWGLVVAMLILSPFLMIPVASAFTSMFLDDVADAVEAVHYPHLAQAPRATLMEGISDSIRFLGLMLVANIAALFAYLLMPPAAPIIFIALNGFLLGREYFQLVAMRRLGRKGAKAARRRHFGAIWATGAMMALPLTIPVLNLAVPIIGAAVFTHLFHRLEALPARG